MVTYTLEALLMDTFISGQLSLRPPSQNPIFLNSHTNSVFLHSRKWLALVMDTFFFIQSVSAPESFHGNKSNGYQ